MRKVSVGLPRFSSRSALDSQMISLSLFRKGDLSPKQHFSYCNRSWNSMGCFYEDPNLIIWPFSGFALIFLCTRPTGAGGLTGVNESTAGRTYLNPFTTFEFAFFWEPATKRNNLEWSVFVVFATSLGLGEADMWLYIHSSYSRWFLRKQTGQPSCTGRIPI